MFLYTDSSDLYGISNINPKSWFFKIYTPTSITPTNSPPVNFLTQDASDLRPDTVDLLSDPVVVHLQSSIEDSCPLYPFVGQRNRRRYRCQSFVELGVSRFCTM